MRTLSDTPPNICYQQVWVGAAPTGKKPAALKRKPSAVDVSTSKSKKAKPAATVARKYLLSWLVEGVLMHVQPHLRKPRLHQLLNQRQDQKVCRWIMPYLDICPCPP
jgi:hypothetical protein